MTAANEVLAEHPPVLARCHGGKPAKLWALAVHHTRRGDRAEVYRTDPGTSLLWPQGDAYRFDDALHAELLTAFEAGDQDRLKALWLTATPFTKENP